MATKLGSLTLDLICRTGNFTQGMRDASSSANRELGRIEQSTNGATNAIKGMAAAALGAFSLSQLSGYADGYIGLQNRLKLVTNSQKELTQATEDTYRISQVTASSWDSTAQVYQRFAQNAKSLGIDLKQAATLTETVSKAIAISGGSAASAEAALIQFGQALSSGVLRGEEFASISEQAGGLRDAIAKGLNLSVKDLRSWAENGKLTTDVVIKALEKSKASVDDLFGKTDFTGAQGWQLIQDAAMKTVGEFSKATGASKAMFESLKLLSENMGVVTNTLMIGGAYMAGTYIPTIYKSVVAAKTKIATLLEEIQTENAAIVQTQRKAQAEYNASQAELTRARDAVVAAEMQVNANRAVIGSEIQRIQATIAATNAEKAQEIQNHKSQITDIGRSQSVTRMAQLQQVLAAQTAELTALEGKLASTTLASSNVYVAARNAETTATGRATVATNQLNIANSLTTRSSMGLVGALGGPVGLGIMVASVAAGFLLMRDSSKDTQSALEEQGLTVDELKVKYSQLNAEQLKLKALGASDAIEAENEKIRTLFISLERYISDLNGQGNTDRANALQQYLEDLKVGGDRAKNAFARLEKQRVVNPEDIAYAAKMGAAVKSSTNEVDKQNQILSIASNKHIEHAKAAKTGAEGVGKVGIEAVSAAAKVKNLGEEVQKFINDSLNSTTDNLRKYQLISQGYTSATADMILAAEKAEGVNGTGGPLSVLSSSVLATQILSQKKLTDLTDARSEAEKKVNEELKKRKELQEMVGASALSGLRIKSSESVAGGKVRGYTAEFAQLTQDALGDKLGRFTSFNDAYHKGTNSKHATGNAFDFTTKSAKDAELAIARLNTLAKQYGFTIKTLNEYSNPSSRATGGHVHVSVLGYKGGEEALKDAKAKLKIDQDYNADRKKEADEVDQFLQQYSDADVVRNKKRIAEIAQAEKLGQTKLIPKINERFSNETRLAELQLEEQLKGWSWAEDEKLKHQAEINKTQIALSTELDDIEKQLHKESIDDRLAYELQQYRKTQLQKQFDQINSYKSIQSQIKGLSGGAEDIFAKASMSPKDYATWSLKNNRDNAQLDLKNQLVSTEQNIATSDSFSNEDERYEALLEAHKNYRDGMYALDVQYTQQSKDLIQAQKMDQLNMWGGILSTAQNTFSQLAQSAKDGLGEQSTTYRTMFAMQQAFSIASSMVAAWTAYTQAFADPSKMTTEMKLAGGMQVMAALMPAITTIGSIGITGMAHDGIDNIPREGTWLLDGGERVLNPNQNKDLTRYLNEARSNQNSQPSQVTVNPNIIITDDRKSISEFMASREGEQIILKTLKRNGYAR
ncbi:tape measure protein [Acinetobacter guillouiae]|uniref:tape measure protein n=1 Tax=Acinetobacter guillouiae TaxID=106649 RepID=UPI003AF7CA0E